MKKSEQFRADILEKVKEFYLATQEEKQVNSRINYAGRVFDNKEISNLVDSSLDFWLTSGKWTKKFEKDLCSFLNIKYSLFVNSGSSANLLAFMCLTSPLLGKRQIKRGDEVITVAACFPTTISPIIQYGAIPVFVDINFSLNIDINKLQKALSSKTKAIMIAHTLGNPFDIAVVKKFCGENNLWLIEDNCDSLGSKVNNQYTGTFGDIGTSSFFPPHHITTGEGGAVYTNNALLYKIMHSMRDWGRDCVCDTGMDNLCGNRFNTQHGTLPRGYDHKYIYGHFGYNLKATDLQASIGCSQLKKLNYFIQKRKDNYNLLYKELNNLNEIVILPPNNNNSWFGFPIIIKDLNTSLRNNLCIYLESKKIQTRLLFSGNITRHPCFDHLKENIDYRIIEDLTITDKIMNDLLWVGVYPGLTKENIEHMIKSIREFFDEQNIK